MISIYCLSLRALSSELRDDWAKHCDAKTVSPKKAAVKITVLRKDFIEIF